MAATQQCSRSVEELAELVYECLKEDNHDGALEAHSRALPAHQEGYRTMHELDYADFALVVGLAYGIARGEDPYERPESVIDRAAAAATIAFERWGHWQVTYAQDRACRPVPDDHPDSPAKEES